MFQWDPQDVDLLFELMYGTNRKIRANFAQTSHQNPFQQSVSAELVLPANSYEASASIQETDNNSYVGKSILRWGDHQQDKIEVSYSLRARNEAYGDYDVNLLLNLFDWDKIQAKGQALWSLNRKLLRAFFESGNSYSCNALRSLR